MCYCHCHVNNVDDIFNVSETLSTGRPCKSKTSTLSLRRPRISNVSNVDSFCEKANNIKRPSSCANLRNLDTRSPNVSHQSSERTNAQQIASEPSASSVQNATRCCHVHGRNEEVDHCRKRISRNAGSFSVAASDPYPPFSPFLTNPTPRNDSVRLPPSQSVPHLVASHSNLRIPRSRFGVSSAETKGWFCDCARASNVSPHGLEGASS